MPQSEAVRDVAEAGHVIASPAMGGALDVLEGRDRLKAAITDARDGRLEATAALRSREAMSGGRVPSSHDGHATQAIAIAAWRRAWTPHLRRSGLAELYDVIDAMASEPTDRTVGPGGGGFSGA
jgi:hypothetical protein